MTESIQYLIQIPLAGAPDNYLTLCRALTPEGAADVVRALLSATDLEGGAVCVRVTKTLTPLPM